MGCLYKPTMAAIEDSMGRVLAMSLAERAQRGQAARAWYLENHRAFIETLRAQIDQLDD